MEFKSEMDWLKASYEQLLAALRHATLSKEERERVQAQLQSRDRAMHNQWVEVCGGEFR